LLIQHFEHSFILTSLNFNNLTNTIFSISSTYLVSFGYDKTGFFTAKIYDAAGHETTSENAVRTAVDFMPNFTYEIYAGGLQTIDVLDTEFYLSSIIAPDIPKQQGGSIYLIYNKYILQPKENVYVAGVGTAEVKYNAQVPVANKLRVFIDHMKGEQHRFQLELQYYA